MTKYLKDRSYYENIYDNKMIETCINMKKNGIKLSQEKKYKDFNIIDGAEGIIMLEKYNWYKNREKHIDKEIERDTKKDQLMNDSIPFPERYCRECNSLLTYEFKEFISGYGNKKDRILFIYKCDDCGKRQAIYNNGEERIIKPKICNKCNEIIEHIVKFEGDILIEDYNCINCGNKYTEKSDFSTSKNKEIKIPKKDREKYGYNEKEKNEYIDSFDRLDETYELVMSYKNKDKRKDLYKKANDLSKLNIVGLQKLVNKEIENTKFSEFKINSHKHVRKGLNVEFNLFYDGEYGDNSNIELIDIFKKILYNTNWEYKKNSFHEKLGIISGDLIGYDNEDDLVELIEKRTNK